MTIAHQNLTILGQGLQLLRALDENLYRAPGPDGRASAGAHLRHAIDYYRCFFRGLESGRIDYDARERDTGTEVSSSVASRAIDEIAVQLHRLGPAEADRSVVVKVDAVAAEGPDPVWSRSTVGRELQFLMSHTVHHYALISVVLRSAGFEPGEDFGVAPSTLEHRDSIAEPVGAR